jgi:hypothetical protein
MVRATISLIAWDYTPDPVKLVLTVGVVNGIVSKGDIADSGRTS